MEYVYLKNSLRDLIFFFLSNSKKDKKKQPILTFKKADTGECRAFLYSKNVITYQDISW